MRIGYVALFAVVSWSHHAYGQAAVSAPTPAHCPQLPPVPAVEAILLEKVDFKALPGWQADNHAEAITAMVRSCDRLDKFSDDKAIGFDGYSGTAKQWRKACASIRKLGAKPDNAAAKTVFEAQFAPYFVKSSLGTEGKFTGYNVQRLRASKKKGGKFVYPIYGRPKDLISADLSEFLPDSKGRTIWGRINPKSKKMEHYATRAEIRKGLLANKKIEVLWGDDKLDIVFAEIEGSAVATLEDGSQVWLEVDGKTSRPYKGMGKILREMGEPPGTGSAQGIRKWLSEHPDRYDEIVDQNEAYVFFKRTPKVGAQGSQGVTLVDKRSIAVDKAFIALGTPLWIDTNMPTATGQEPWQHLVVAQDTGGGIKGVIRADIYWGADDAAAETAGKMNHKGNYYVLLPAEVVVPASVLAPAKANPK